MNSQLEQDLLDGIRANLERNWDFKAAYGIVANRRLWTLYRDGKLTWEEVVEISELNLFTAREIGDISREVDSLHGLGWAYRNTALYSESFGFYREALEITKNGIQNLNSTESAIEKDLLFREYFLLTEIGILYTDLAQYDAALLSLEESLEKNKRYAEQYSSPALHANIYSTEVFQGFTLYNIGILRLQTGDSETALEYFLDVRNNYPPFDGGGLYLNIGNVHFNLGEFGEAAEAFEQSSRFVFLGDPGMPGFALNGLGRSQVELGNYAQAFGCYQRALRLFKDLNDPAGESQTLSNLAALAERQNEPELAIALYKESVNILESIRDNLADLPIEARRSYTESVSDRYRSLADLLLQEDRIVEAQRVLDLLKVQELDDYIRGVERTSETETGMAFLRPEELILARYDELQTSAIAVGQELDDLKNIPQTQRSAEQVQRIAQLTDLLDEINGDFRDFASSPDIRSLIDQLSFEAQEASLSLNQLDRLRDELQQLNAAIFYPLILEDRLELVITVPDSPPLRRTVDVSRKELNAAILAFRTALTDPHTDAAAPAQQLYDWLIRPLEADLAAAGVETIIYSPDGQLRYIPLAALHDGDRWLIQQYRINNITAESLTDLTESDATQLKILAAAYANESLVHSPEVNGTTYTFSGLPGAGQEVDGLPTETKFFDEAFSLAAIRPILDEYTVLHFATHAAFVPGVPEDSFILFGNGDTPTLRDVADWSLNGVDLVVLSACETGVGGLGNGEEILGLGYQFQVSGAKAVMSSLWQVSDRGTQVLMTDFYAALNRGLTKAEALQAAQQALIAEELIAIEGSDRAGAPPTSREGSPIESNYPGYSHPYYWAPFILIGNGL
ncbi:MAG: CHAT domain-containing protein [Leptolyngbyaceae cyanobacterium SM1_1_3]|nr:CHAT domain-containing protein [Leptolyngbyaceae cyanobacterium SM1_1_3]